MLASPAFFAAVTAIVAKQGLSILTTFGWFIGSFYLGLALLCAALAVPACALAQQLYEGVDIDGVTVGDFLVAGPVPGGPSQDGKAALARATQYAKERIVFGRPIGKNQAIQHPLAESWMQLEAANLQGLKIRSPLVCASRQGVCQDFSNLFICMMRLLGVPAGSRTRDDTWLRLLVAERVAGVGSLKP